jgi:hypothetical protein
LNTFQTLYPGLYDVVVKNPELCPKVLQMLHQHALGLGLNNPNAICPVDSEEAVIEQENEAIVVVSILTIAILLQRPVYCFWRADFHGQGATLVTPDNLM